MKWLLQSITLLWLLSCEPSINQIFERYDGVYRFPYDSIISSSSLLQDRENNARWQLYRKMRTLDVCIYDSTSGDCGRIPILSCWMRGSSIKEENKGPLFENVLTIYYTIHHPEDYYVSKPLFPSQEDVNSNLYYVGASFIYNDPNPAQLRKTIGWHVASCNINPSHYLSSKDTYPKQFQSFMDSCGIDNEYFLSYMRITLLDELNFIKYIESRPNVHPWLRREAIIRRQKILLYNFFYLE